LKYHEFVDSLFTNQPTFHFHIMRGCSAVVSLGMGSHNSRAVQRKSSKLSIPVTAKIALTSCSSSLNTAAAPQIVTTSAKCSVVRSHSEGSWHNTTHNNTTSNRQNNKLMRASLSRQTSGRAVFYSEGKRSEISCF